MPDNDILFEVRGPLGLVTLNRPQALNAITHAMVNAMQERLDAWAADAAISRVAIRAAGGRAFSAGGDIRALYELGQAKDPRRRAFFADEYRLDHRIGTYPKPYLALIDGLVMGGGAGVSILGRFRVGTERAAYAMPEVAIGFFPDVGATYVLSRLPGGLGAYVALTGERLRQADALAAGVLTHATRTELLDDFLDALAAGEPVEEVLRRFSRDPGPSALAEERGWIDRVFSADSVREVLRRLDSAAGEGWDRAAVLAGAIRAKSPTSLEIALRQVRRGRSLSLAECLQLEYRIVSRVLEGSDFDEGIRAVIIDKDNRPRWRPAHLDDVDPDAIEAHFAPLPDGDLVLP